MALLSRGGSSGYEPFTRASLFMAIGTTAVVVIAPVGRRLRIAGGVTIAMLLVVYLVHTPVGANATRIAVLVAAPVVVAAARVSRRALMVGAVALAALLPLAQFHNDLTRQPRQRHLAGVRCAAARAAGGRSRSSATTGSS